MGKPVFHYDCCFQMIPLHLNPSCICLWDAAAEVSGHIGQNEDWVPHSCITLSLHYADKAVVHPSIAVWLIHEEIGCFQFSFLNF